MDVTEESAAATADQARRLRDLCVAVHHTCRAEAKHLDALLEEANEAHAEQADRQQPDPETQAKEEAKERLLAQRVGAVVKKLQPLAGRR